MCYCISFYVGQRLKNASNANLTKHYHKINKSAGDFLSARHQLSYNLIAGHTEVVIEEIVHAAGAGTVAAAEVIKCHGRKVGRVGFRKEGGDASELVFHIFLLYRFLDSLRSLVIGMPLEQ